MKYLFEWTRAISVGDETIDKQHQKLLNELNILLSNLFADSSDKIINEAVSFLSEYIDDHLAYEEKYMKEYKYPEIDFHTSLHRGFIDQYKVFKKRLADGAPKKELILEIEEYIGSWWIHHISVEDKKYAVFIQQREKKHSKF